MKSVHKQGVCPEALWQYDTSKFASKPTAKCYSTALKNETLSYHRVSQTSEQMRGCLAEGYPFVFGFSVYESFESPQVAASGILPMPAPNEKMIGGHAVMAAGYDDSKKCFIIRNSWGAGWGMQGYFFMPYEYITNSNLADDFWTIRMVE